MWIYVKVIFEILGKIKNLLGKLLKRTIKKNIFSKENSIKRKE